MKPCWINISGGEPTLNPELESILTFFVEQHRPFLITLATNGFIDCSSMIRRVLNENRRCRLNVSVSIDGSARIHDTARGVPGAYFRSKRTFDNLRLCRADFPLLTVGVSVTVSHLNYREVIPFIAEMIRETSSVNVNFAQHSVFYGNRDTDSFSELPSGVLIELGRRIQRLFLRPEFDAIVRVLFLEAVIRKLQGRPWQLPCASCQNNILVTSQMELMECTLCFTPWHAAQGARELRVSRIVQAIVHPMSRRRALYRAVRKRGCDANCLTPCETYLHLIGALLSPRHGPQLIWAVLLIAVQAFMHNKVGRRTTTGNGRLTHPHTRERIS